MKNTFGISGILGPCKFLMNQAIERSKGKTELRAGEKMGNHTVLVTSTWYGNRTEVSVWGRMGEEQSELTVAFMFLSRQSVQTF